MTREYQPDFFDEGPGGAEILTFAQEALAADRDMILSLSLPAGVLRMCALLGFVLEDGGYTPEAHKMLLGEPSEPDAAIVQAKAAAWLRHHLTATFIRDLKDLTRAPELVSLIEDERVRNGAKPYEDAIPW